MAVESDDAMKPEDFPVYDEEHPPTLCDYCGRDAHIGRVTVANLGTYCSRDCADAAFGHVYCAKKRRTG